LHEYIAKMEDCLTCDLFRKIPVDLMLEAINRFARLGSSRARLQNRIEIVLGYAVFDEASKTFRLRALARVYDEAIEKKRQSEQPGQYT
jgi:hypothetical protein